MFTRLIFALLFLASTALAEERCTCDTLAERVAQEIASLKTDIEKINTILPQEKSLAAALQADKAAAQSAKTPKAAEAYYKKYQQHLEEFKKCKEELITVARRAGQQSASATTDLNACSQCKAAHPDPAGKTCKDCGGPVPPLPNLE